ncbi:MAG: NAD+ synthase [Candidatus Schekmanbacteria bacterium RBG_16_38_10]|uniref:Glutamine-dependent NAD(+) synthetase n=1 Tax=Candidatus Schekmanbacteria bacterium RBG_16_38_10 TaxID=1817879 RepID=A0A1F7RRW1_9BACT|nr:MAG: NAD+ synthase [Candidatus Schekmanbacteria bacterium RBG_16_38_10]
MRFALLQLNFTVGDIEGNALKIINAVKTAKEQNVNLCITSELALMGYPPRDLLLNTTFINKTQEKITQLAVVLTKCPPTLVGVAMPNPSGQGRPLFNSAVLLKGGEVEEIFHKSLLPTYDVFDEDRYFEPSPELGNLDLNGKKIGITICEDIWNDKTFWSARRYTNDPVEWLVNQGVDLIINISASPFSIGKQKIREAMLGNMANKYQMPVLYVNQVGGNDDLVFDGRSCAFDSKGRMIARGKPFHEDILIVDTEATAKSISDDDFTPEAEAWNALVCGTKDYIKKCGFGKALLGLSGGIDSALTSVIAVEAIGKENVIGALMPSPYSSKGSVDDSLNLAQNLGIKTLTLPISLLMEAFDKTLEGTFTGYEQDITEENIQSRIRGNLLMALSNKYGALLLTTGNKSELAVGYCTIYGDMSGGLAVIADVPKTMVYRLSNWINKTKGNIIPQAVIDKAPSAELRPNQRDQDSLPPYDILDEILYIHVELHKSAEEIIEDGFDETNVLKILSLVSKAEFKRKQAAPGIKITDRAFGTGWRMPIAHKWNF